MPFLALGGRSKYCTPDCASHALRCRKRKQVASEDGREAARGRNQRWAARNRSHLADKRRAKRLEVQALISDFKVKRGCADCGYNRYAEAMDFDHVDGVKKFTISRVRDLNEFLLELEKCDVVCARCHRERTFIRRMARRERRKAFIIWREEMQIDEIMVETRL